MSDPTIIRKFDRDEELFGRMYGGANKSLTKRLL